MSINPSDSENIDRDRFLLSKGHGAPALFQVLAERGFFDKKDLEDFGKAGSYFHEHPPKPGLIKGVEAATGSLGHGFPMALGMAISAKIQKKVYRTYALLSDGECNEGSIWEAAMLAASLKINNLIALIDYNKWQATGRSKEIMALEPFAAKWESFGWDCQEINGHSFDELRLAFKKIEKIDNKPSVIIAHTIKGKGVSFMEDDNNWHYRIPNKKELELALEENSDLAK
tara:strand:- start:665 stop:1351 length:687 start_codon:yes stop_codon:yes gene_type:complete